MPNKGFPDWLYDDDRWNDYLHLFNYGALEIAAREVGYQLGFYPERARYDATGTFYLRSRNTTLLALTTASGVARYLSKFHEQWVPIAARNRFLENLVIRP
jgi:hypothetical protein